MRGINQIFRKRDTKPNGWLCKLSFQLAAMRKSSSSSLFIKVLFLFGLVIADSATAEVIWQEKVTQPMAAEFGTTSQCSIRVDNAFPSRGILMQVGTSQDRFTGDQIVFLSVKDLPKDHSDNALLVAGLKPCKSCLKDVLENCFPGNSISNVMIYGSRLPHESWEDNRSDQKHFAGFGVCVEGSHEEVRYISRGLWTPVLTHDALISDHCK